MLKDKEQFIKNKKESIEAEKKKEQYSAKVTSKIAELKGRRMITYDLVNEILADIGNEIESDEDFQIFYEIILKAIDKIEKDIT